MHRCVTDRVTFSLLINNVRTIDNRQPVGVVEVKAVGSATSLKPIGKGGTTGKGEAKVFSDKFTEGTAL